MFGDKNFGLGQAYRLGCEGKELPNDVKYGRVARIAYSIGELLHPYAVEIREQAKENQRVWDEAISKTRGDSEKALKVLHNAAILLDNKPPKYQEYSFDTSKVEWARKFTFTELARQEDATATWLLTEEDKREPEISIIIAASSRVFPVHDIEILHSAPIDACDEPGAFTIGRVKPGTTILTVNSAVRTDVTPGDRLSRLYTDQNGVLVPNSDDGFDGSFVIELDALGQVTEVCAGRNNLNRMPTEPDAQVDVNGLLKQLDNAIFETSQALPKISR